MEIYAETERLILREPLPKDAEGMFELDSNPRVHEYLGNKPLKSRNQALEIIEYVRQQYKENGIGRWAVIQKSDNRFIGWSGLKLVKDTINNHSNYVDLGYRLIEPYWGKGIATESALASLKYGFEVMHLTDIYAAAHIENAASNHILNKIGFRFINTFEYDRSTHNWYRLEGQATWRGPSQYPR